MVNGCYIAGDKKRGRWEESGASKKEETGWWQHRKKKETEYERKLGKISEKWKTKIKTRLLVSRSTYKELRGCHSVLTSKTLNRLKNQQLFFAGVQPPQDPGEPSGETVLAKRMI